MGVNLTCASADPRLSVGSLRQGAVQMHLSQGGQSGLQLVPTAAVGGGAGVLRGPAESHKGCPSQYVTSSPEPFLS